MAVVNAKIPEFPGFAVQYDPAAKPFFVSMVVEDLRRITSKEIGKTLLKQIADARPRGRSAPKTSNAEAKLVKFNEGINVVVVPTSVTFTQTGHKMAFTGVGMEKSLVPSTAKAHNIKLPNMKNACPFHIAGGSCAEALDIIAAGNGTGSVSIMKYTNAQIITGKGEATSSFLVLAHELIHSLHHVTGTRRDGVEEDWTTGIGSYQDELMTENSFRRVFGMPLRVSY
jgi:hypothetical protein